MSASHPSSRSPSASRIGLRLSWSFRPAELENFMYMGRAGEIELYKHRFTRRYLNISADGRRFYRYSDGMYVEVSQTSALDYVRDL